MAGDVGCRAGSSEACRAARMLLRTVKPSRLAVVLAQQQPFPKLIQGQ
jgi:hypothetical protein